MIPFHAINEAALLNLETILHRRLPAGQRRGREYLALNPTRRDRHIGSFRINLETGRWADFATGDRGGDVISLIAYIDCVSQADAAQRLADDLGIPLPEHFCLSRSTQQIAQDRTRRQEEKKRAGFWRIGRLAALEFAKEKAVETRDVALLAAAAAEAWELRQATGWDLLDLWRAALKRDPERTAASENDGREDARQAACLTGIAVAVIAATNQIEATHGSHVDLRRNAT